MDDMHEMRRALVKTTIAIISRALADHGPGYIAFSGGTDSNLDHSPTRAERR